MPFNDELQFEEAFVTLLHTKCGWEHEVIKNPTEEDLIDNWAAILYESNKEKDVLNGCPLTEGEMAQVLALVTELKTPLALNNFINGKTVSITRDNENDLLHFGNKVSLHIYDRMEIAGGKSRYQIVEQPRYKTNNSVFPARRGDVLLLINGMPLFHIELKKTGVPITHAEVQIEKYMANGVFRGIFSLVQIFVAMNPEDAVYYANPGPNGRFNSDFYFHWEDFNNNIVSDWKSFTTNVLSIPMAHEMVGFYTIPDDSDGILKVMHSYQCIAAVKISEKVASTHWTKDEQHGGFIWHTTGSGKTMTSFKSAQLIANSKKADKVVFLIDRIELGDQSLINYRNFADPSESVQATEDTWVLISKLKSDIPDDTLIVTSIQKMSRIREDGDVKEKDLKKIKSKHIVFIIDECHRDQKGEMHQNIKETFPNAIYFGFTGTPDHNYTADIFGNELHRYTIVHGIKDKNVLGFDPYKICIFSDEELREKIALEQCHCSTMMEAMGNPATKDKFLYYMNHGKIKCSMTEIESFIPKAQYETDKYRTSVVDEIIKKWDIRSVNSEFHAIFATSSIKEAIKYYSLFKSKNHALHITAIFDPTDSNNETSISKMKGITEILTDYHNMFGVSFDIGSYSHFKEDVCARLSHKQQYVNLKTEERIDIVIVVDQLLTGFDSKWINTLYLDKEQKGKNLIQAISRTNRLFGKDKPHGTVVWYRYPHTMEKNLEEAVNEYSGNRPLGIFVNKLDSNLTQMNLKYTEIIDLFRSMGIIDFIKNADDDSWKKKFAKSFSEFNRYLESAKIQGFMWKTLSYDFKQDNGSVNTIEVSIDEKTYLTLVQRYKELFSGSLPHIEDIPYDIDTHITEIPTTAIDDDYMNSKFSLYLKNISCGNIEARDAILQELHKSFAYLSQEEQKFAKMFLHDLDSGDVVIEENKSLRDYITEYVCRAYNDNIHKFSVGLGIDETLLRELINANLNETTLNSHGKFDDLLKTLDINKAKTFFEMRTASTLSLRQTKIKAVKEIIKFIVDGVFEI